MYREADTLNSMGLAGLALLAFNPYSLFSAGFQLSFVSVTAILVFNTIYERKKNSIVNSIKEMIIISLFVNICTLPILAYNFYEVPVYGFITNIFVIPFLGILTAMGFASAAFWCLKHCIGYVFRRNSIYNAEIYRVYLQYYFISAFFCYCYRKAKHFVCRTVLLCDYFVYCFKRQQKKQSCFGISYMCMCFKCCFKQAYF